MSEGRRISTPILVGIVGAILASLVVLRVWTAFERDATIFVAFGVDSIEINHYAEGLLGREVEKRDGQGHDGKYFFVQANDPLILEPEDNAAVLDRPVYRSQRMLYPLLAGGGGLFSADAIVATLVLINVVALGVGTWVVALLAVRMGGAPWWGLAFVLNLGFISEMNIDGAGVVAAAAAFGAVLMLLDEKLGWAVALLTISVLSREAMLIAVVGSAFWLWRRERRRDALMGDSRSRCGGGRVGTLCASPHRVRLRPLPGPGDRLAVCRLPGCLPGVERKPCGHGRRVGDDAPLRAVHQEGPGIRRAGGVGLPRVRPPGHPLHPAGMGELRGHHPGRRASIHRVRATRVRLGEGRPTNRCSPRILITLS